MKKFDKWIKTNHVNNKNLITAPKEFKMLTTFLNKYLYATKKIKNDYSIYRFIPSGAEFSKRNF